METEHSFTTERLRTCLREHFRSFSQTKVWGRGFGPVRMGLRSTNRHEIQGGTGGFACRRDQRRQVIVREQVTLSPALVPYWLF